MRKTFRYRIYSNKQTFQKAEHWLSLCRLLYNTFLEWRIIEYKTFKKSLSYYDQQYRLKYFKQAFPEYKKVDAQVLYDVLQRLDKAYKNFFRRVKNGEKKAGFPRFKGVDRYNSFTLQQNSWKLEGKYLIVRNVGRFKIKLSRPIEGVIKTVTIRRSSTDKWHVGFSCDNVSTKPLPKTGKTIGIDVGCESFLTNSDGRKVKNPRFFKKSQDVLKKRQQRVSCRERGSNRRKKAGKLIAKAYEKVFNQRRDFHFKTVNQLLKESDIICIEKLQSWNSWRSLNRSMRDVAWFNFFSILKAKAVEAERQIVEVDPKGTSQNCSRCGKKVPKELSVRIHSCPFCHLVIDRDHNAALNILVRAGLSGIGFTLNSENLLTGMPTLQMQCRRRGRK